MEYDPRMPPRPFHEDSSSASTVHQQRFDLSDLAEASFSLTAVEGPDRGLVFVLEAPGTPRALLGTGPACEFRLTCRAVSRRHAELEVFGTKARIADVGSTNGTWVNGVSIVEARLGGGEHVKIGDDVFLVQRHTPATREALPTAQSFGRVLGSSVEMRRLYALCARLSSSSIPIIIEGETGTGKEALAESLHEQGPRAQKPFVVFDCTAISPSMMEAELFGHERGAFTGAVNRHAGVLEQAHEGTLLIDEIGDLDLALQPKLLRAIERGEFRRIGADRPTRVDVRILAATRRNLDLEVEAGRFRDDLFHRLAVGRIELPPLRRRRGDVAVLARAFWKALGGDEGALSPALIGRWEEHSWPGNVRELRNAVARFLALGDQPAFAHSAAPESRPGVEAKGTNPAMTEGESVARVVEQVLAEGFPLVRAREKVVSAFEERYLETMLARHGGVVARAAEAAGIARRHFHRLRARTR